MIINFLESMIEIRNARIADAEMIVKLGEELLQSQVVIVNKSHRAHKADLRLNKNAAEHHLKFVKRLIRSKSGLALIAEDNGLPAGYLLAMIKPNIPLFKLEKLGEITDIYIRKKYRGSGVSSKLKVKAFKWLKEKGVKKVSLNVFPGNKKAVGVYEHWGFSAFQLEMRRNV
jgi:ribosomal protein S18 acetylase RimI-like enzyme